MASREEYEREQARRDELRGGGGGSGAGSSTAAAHADAPSMDKEKARTLDHFLYRSQNTR